MILILFYSFGAEGKNFKRCCHHLQNKLSLSRSGFITGQKQHDIRNVLRFGVALHRDIGRHGFLSSCGSSGLMPASIERIIRV